MKSTHMIYIILAVIAVAAGFLAITPLHSSEYSVCVTNEMQVNVSSQKVLFGESNFAAGSLGPGGMGCQERIQGIKIPDKVTVNFAPIRKEKDNPSFTVEVDMKDIPKDANGKIFFTIKSETEVTVKYISYEEFYKKIKETKK